MQNEESLQAAPIDQDMTEARPGQACACVRVCMGARRTTLFRGNLDGGGPSGNCYPPRPRHRRPVGSGSENAQQPNPFPVIAEWRACPDSPGKTAAAQL